MSDERFNLIKENVYTRCHIAKHSGIGLSFPDKEEIELIDYAEELKGQLQQKENIIKEVREYLKFLKEHYEELRTSPVEDSYFINDMLRQMFIQSIENYLVGIEDILDKENN